jgi:calcium channel MID1
VIFNLSFCDQTAYAVPANPNLFSTISSLASFYDNATSGYYQFFKNALAQIPCNTTASSKYSLARTCDDCAAAYKQWLCAVTIPRCTDFSSNQTGLQPRSMVNPFPDGTSLPDVASYANLSAPFRMSRNPAIDQYVMPGPYKEILPCDDLCHGIVQSCPSSMGFACPRPGQLGFNTSYGTRSKQGPLMCSYPGADFDEIVSNAGVAIKPHVLMIIALVVMMWGFA